MRGGDEAGVAASNPDLRSCFGRSNGRFYIWSNGDVTVGRDRRAGTRKVLAGETKPKDIRRQE